MLAGAGALLGAILFRIRGGLLGDYGAELGTIVSRLAWAIGLASGGALVAWDWLILLIAPGLFVGCVIGWPSSIDMGRNEGTWLRDALGMLWRGPLWTVPAGATLVLVGYPHGYWFAASGLLCPVCYELGWRVPYSAKWAVDGSAWGEIIFGATIGAALAITVI